MTFPPLRLAVLICGLVIVGCSGEATEPGSESTGTTPDASSGAAGAADTASAADAGEWVSQPGDSPDLDATGSTPDAEDLACESPGAVRCFGGLPQTCVDGVWTYGDACTEGQICVDGLCVTGCAPSCQGKECGDDGCGGSCGLCDGGLGCEEGVCVEAVCEPVCQGKVCGADGCGGLCGACETGELCAPDGSVCVACGPAEMLDCEKSCVATVSYADGNCDAALACSELLYDGGDCPEECPPAQLINCTGTCSLAAWKGDGKCDEQLNCEEQGYDAGDCDIPCEVGTTQDCVGGCSEVALLGDGNCDQSFSCADLAFDSGDCEIECDEGKIQNCVATCTTETWLGDDFCDTLLNCEAFDWDGGDCCPEGTTKSCDDDVCVQLSLKGNGVCDEVFACESQNFDGGDCPVVCPEDKIENCESGCTLASWLADDFCDSKFNCVALNFDEGDCEPCYPDCDGKNCGSDGCGKDCGVCGAGLICGEEQLCVEPGQGSDCDDPFVVGAVPWTASGDTKLTSANFNTETDACPGLATAYGSGSNDHVYEFTPEVEGVYTVSVTAEFDSLTYVARDCQDIASTCLGAVDKVGAGVEEVTFKGFAGERVYLFVDGWSNGTNLAGPYTIDVSEPCLQQCEGKVCGADGCGLDCGTCPQGNSCSLDGSSCVDNTLIQGNTCVNPFEFGQAPGQVSGDTTNASNDYNVPEEGGCEGTSSTLGKASFEQVWRFVLQSTGVYTVTLSADFDSALYIVGDCEAMSDTCFGAKDKTGDEVLLISGQPGEEVFIVVDGYSSTQNLTGTYELSISEPCIGSCEGKVCGGDGCGSTCGICGEGEGCDPVGQCLPFELLPGNTCDDPVQLTSAPSFVSGETTGATNDFAFEGGDCPGLATTSRGGASNDRVHAFTAELPGVYTFSLEADFDTVLYVVKDCADVGGTCQGAADKVGVTEEVLVLLAAGETAYAVVDGWSDYSNTTGEYTLGVSEPCTPSCEGKTCGDDGCGSTCGSCQPGYICSEAQACLADDAQVGNVCFNPLFIPSAPYEVTGTTEGFNANYFFSADSCPGENFGMGEASNDVAYRFTAPQTATYTFRLNADYDSLLYVVGDCFEVNETCEAASDLYNGAEEVVLVSMVAGETVFVIVDGFSNYSPYAGGYTLTLDEPCVPTCGGKQCGDNGCGGVCGECVDGDICSDEGMCLDAADIPGNVCTNPFNISPGETIQGDSTSASNAFSFSANVCEGTSGAKGGASRDLVYRFEAPESAVYEVTLTSEFDSALYVLTDCGDIDNSCLGGVDGAIQGDETLSFSAEAGQVYFIIVDGWSNYSDLYGPFTLSLAEPCIQQCEGKACGPDGCGQSCGTCPGFESCNNDGQCEACEPECDGKDCGDDGCGGVCGTCAEGEGCTDQGLCSGGASCAGVCGGAGDGCFCDEFCFDSGDCCDDICDLCLDEPGVAAQCSP